MWILVTLLVPPYRYVDADPERVEVERLLEHGGGVRLDHDRDATLHGR